MNLPPPRRHLASSLLCSLVLLSCGGSSNSGPSKPDLPQASINVDETNTVGKSVKLSVAVVGCTKVQKLELLDHDTVLHKMVTYTTNPTPVELTADDIDFSQGIAANLSLTARVTCDDGRMNVSQAQAATFLPVSEAVEPVSEDDQVVPDYFVIDGSGDSAAFIGCGLDNNRRPLLYRVRKSDPTHADSIPMAFACDTSTVITDRKPAGTGTRWVWTPGQGAMAIDSNFRVTGDADQANSVLNLTVAPDGSAIVSDGHTIQRILPAGGAPKWTVPNDDVSNGGDILGDPIVRKGGTAGDTIAVAKQEQSLTDNSVDVRVAVFRYSDGSLQATYKIAHITPSVVVMGTFDATGTVLYLSSQISDTTASVQACAVGVSTTELCKPGTKTKTQLWVSDLLQGFIVALVPYDNGTRLAALTSNRYWFLDAQNSSSTLGKVLNKDLQPFTPTGALVARYAIQSTNSGAFYVLNNAAGTAAYPIEILATDAAEKGLLYRYQTPGNSLYGALDDSGAMWLRVGRRLVKPLALTDYRQKLGR